MRRAAIVFVHGLFSSRHAWEPLRKLIASDPDLAHITVLYFEYQSPVLKLSPQRRIPDFDDLAELLRIYMETKSIDYSDIVLASHGHGGLIVERYLARMVVAGRAQELRRIRRVVMFAAPNSWSEIFPPLRHRAWRWRHPQESELRRIKEEVSAAHEVVINKLVRAQRVASDEYPVLVNAYAGDRDNVVTAMSAKSLFPDTGLLPGDHYSIIRPNSAQHRTYLALKGHLVSDLSMTGSPAITPDTPTTSFDWSNISGHGSVATKVGDSVFDPHSEMRHRGGPLRGLLDGASRAFDLLASSFTARRTRSVEELAARARGARNRASPPGHADDGNPRADRSLDD